MVKNQNKQDGFSVYSAIVWLAGVLVVMLFSFMLLSIVSDKKVNYKYDTDNIGRHVTLIGDSISSMSKDEILEELPGIDFEAVRGIKFSEYREGVGEGGLTRLKRHAMRDVIVFLLGSNGGVNSSELNDLIDYVGPKRKIILMTTYRETADMQKWNQRVYKYFNSEDNIYLIDWYIINLGNADRYLLNDRVHPNKEGRAYFAKMIKQTVLEALELSE